MAVSGSEVLDEESVEQTATDGVFPRSNADSSDKSSQGELVDRLLAKIADLESKLYERELERHDFIPAVRGKSPSGKGSLQQSVNSELLSSLGDPDKRTGSGAVDGSKRDWLAVGASWLSKNVLTHATNGSNTINDNTPNTVQSTDSSGSSPRRSRGPSIAAATATNGTPKTLSAPSGAPLPRVSPQADNRTAGTGLLTTSRSNHALADLGLPAASSLATQGSHHSSQGAWRSTLKHYYRYYMPADGEDQGGDEEARRVQEAAGAALAEANERLLEAEMKLQAAQAAQKQLEQQAAAAEHLSAEVEQLKSENLEAWKLKYDLEGQTAAYKANLDGLQRQESSMQKELDDMRKQAKIWSDANSSEVDKMRAEAQLLNEQLAQRNVELSSLREQLTTVGAERDRCLQEKHQLQDEHNKLLQQMEQCSALQQQLASATAAAAASGAAAADWEEKFMRERSVRRQLHEQLQVLRGNIRVMCRVRPPLPSSPSKAGNYSSSCISFPLEGLLSVRDAATARQREFEFDAVFAPEATQQQVFEEVLPLVRSCADGYNACIFAYGQTGSGKTYTMDGPADSPGINTRALQELFSIAADEVDHSWSFSVAMLEIYNEAVHDLLAVAAAGPNSAAQSLDVSGLPAGELPANMDRVPGLQWRKVSTLADVQAVLREGARARATAATALNATSSRSHALLPVKVKGVREGHSFTSMLHLVDLAGSERIEKSEVTGQQLKEAQAINKSLSALGDVVAALQRRGAHIPFRNSKLTQVLQDSLCGSSKVLLVCNLSPETASCSETLSSLNFASRAAQVELGQARRVTTSAAASNNSTAAADVGAAAAEGGSGSIEAGNHRRTTSSVGVTASSSKTDASSDRGNSPSPTKQHSPGAAANTSSLRVSMSGAAAGSPGRPSSRLSDKPPVGPGISSTVGSGSPRVSGLMAKPARH